MLPTATGPVKLSSLRKARDVLAEPWCLAYRRGGDCLTWEFINR